jgi:hypothetical protein
VELVPRAPVAVPPRPAHATSPRRAPRLVWRAPPADEPAPAASLAAPRPPTASPPPSAVFASTQVISPPSAPPAAPLDMTRLVDEVMRRLDQRVRSERQRRGV